MRLSRSIIVSGILAAFLVVCVAPQPGWAQAKPYRLGALLSLSGPASLFGLVERDTVELAVEIINKRGGIKGRRLEVIIEDDKSSANEGVSAANKLIYRDNVLGIIGSTVGYVTQAILPIAIRAGVSVIAPNSTILVTQVGGPWAFRSAPNDKLVVEAVLDRLSQLNLAKMAILHETAAFGAQASDELVRLAPTYKREIVARERYDPKDMDMSAQLIKIRGAQPDALVVWGSGAGPAIIFRNMKDLGMMNIPRFVPLGVATKANAEAAAGGMEGVQVAGILDAQNPLPRQKEFVEAFRAKYNRLPANIEPTTWDPVFLFAEAIAKGGEDRAAIRAALEGIRGMALVVGTYNFAPDNHEGVSFKDMVWLVTRGTSYVRVDK